MNKYKNILLGAILLSCSSEKNPNSSIGSADDSTGIKISDTMNDSSKEDSSTISDSAITDDRFDILMNRSDIGICADITVEVEQVIPTIIIIIDRSGSMDTDFGGLSRWAALRNALMDPTNGVIQNLQSQIRFGVVFYDGEPLACPNILSINPILNNYNQINLQYMSLIPGMETPTGETIQIVQNDLANLVSNDPKAIVLATDGEPDLCSDPNGDGKDLVIDAIIDAYGNGIETYIISVGLDTSTDHLQQAANAGVGLDINDPQGAPFYETTDQTELMNAFETIIGNYVSCQFVIDGDINPDSICDGTVLIDNQVINCGSDWDVMGNILNIYGESCDILKDGQQHQIDARFPCDAVYIP